VDLKEGKFTDSIWGLNEVLAADQLAVVMKLLKGNGAKGLASLTFHNSQPKGMID